MKEEEPSHVTTLNNLINSCIRSNESGSKNAIPNFEEKLKSILRESGLDSSGIEKAVPRIILLFSGSRESVGE